MKNQMRPECLYYNLSNYHTLIKLLQNYYLFCKNNITNLLFYIK